MMMPLCSISLLTASTGAVYFLIVLSTCSTEECGLQITEKMRGRSVVFRNTDISFCQTECFGDFFMFASCHRPSDESKSTKEAHGPSVRPLNHPNISTGACSHVNCKSNTRCVEKRGGGAVCVEGDAARSTLEIRCSSDTDCPAMFECFIKTCKCFRGYNFNPPNGNCVRRCNTYSDGFTTYHGLGIKGHNDRIARNTTAKECYKMCITEKTFTCITYEHHEVGVCELSKYGYLDVLFVFRQVGLRVWNMSVRNCS